MPKRLKATARVLPDGMPFTVLGRDAWALIEFHNAGAAGCTPFSQSGPRWGVYVLNLRNNQHFNIETIHEARGGMFAGTHARYMLHSHVEIIETNESSPQTMMVLS